MAPDTAVPLALTLSFTATSAEMSLPISVLLLALLATAAWLDAWHRRIPNALVAAVAVLWLATLPGHGPAAAIGALATAGGVLAAGMLLWRYGWLGGGDVKLAAALALWAGLPHAAGLLLAIALSGGALAFGSCLVWRSPILALAAAWLPRSAAACGQDDGPNVAASARSLPYGVAIASGGCWLIHRLST